MPEDEIFPDELLRGISRDNDQFITPEGYATMSAFLFDEYDPNLRDDGFCELSINWVDDEGAVDVLLNQINTKKNAPQFQGGYCRFERSTINNYFLHLIESGYLSYERRPIEADSENGRQGNKYHGNILLNKDISKPMRVGVQTSLALLAGVIIKRKK